MENFSRKCGKMTTYMAMQLLQKVVCYIASPLIFILSFSHVNKALMLMVTVTSGPGDCF